MSAKLPPLAEIAKEAGDAIAAMQADVVANKRWEIKDDGSPVTIADTKANEIVCAGLKKHFPDVAIVSEENPEEENIVALQARDRFDTDPLDNTSGYMKNKDGYSVNIGRIVDGVPTEGVIYFPAKKELYFTGADGKAYLQQGEAPPKEIKVRGVPLRDPLKVAVGFREQNIGHLGGRNCEAAQHAAQRRTCMVACGECDVTGVNHGHDGGFNSWDVAGPHAVLRAAGGEIVTTDKKPMRYEKGSIKLPDHFAGGVDTLLALGLVDKELVKTGQRRA